MEKEGDLGYYSSTGEFIAAPKKQLFRLQIPYALRFALIWTLFFIIIGVAIQSFRAETLSSRAFFVSNYGDWFRAFGTFTNTVQYGSPGDFLARLFSDWYYFFYTGGLIALIWGFISWAINSEIIFKKIQKPAPLVSQINAPKKQEPEKELEPAHFQEHKEKIEEWLEEGLRLLADKNIEEAELIYKSLRQEYDPYKDPYQTFYKRIMDFYAELNEERSRKR